MPRISYISEKMRIAVETLATSGSTKDHLFSVAETLSRLQRKDFDELSDPSFGVNYSSIMDRLTAAGTYEESIKALSEEEAEELAGDIVNLAFSSEREYGRAIVSGEAGL